MRRAIVLAGCALLALGAAKMQRTAAAKDDSSEQIRKEVLDLENQRDQALMKNDGDWFERMFADDIDYNAGTGSKEQIVSMIQSRARTWQSVRHDDYNVRTYGDTAVVTYRSGSTSQYQGKVSTVMANTTDVYVKQGGVWHAVVHDVIPIAKP